MEFELRELRYFVAVAETLHLGRAAERVGINQSPWSKAITIMERNFGLKLFVRTRKSTSLTPAGASLLTDARRVSAEADRTLRNLSAAASGRKGTLVVVLCDDAALPRVASLLARCRQEDQHVHLTIERLLLPDQVERLI